MMSCLQCHVFTLLSSDTCRAGHRQSATRQVGHVEMPLLLLVLCSSDTRANAPTSPQEDALRHEQNEQRALDKVEAAREAEIFVNLLCRRVAGDNEHTREAGGWCRSRGGC